MNNSASVFSLEYLKMHAVQILLPLSISLLFPMIYINSQSTCRLNFLCSNFQTLALALPSPSGLWFSHSASPPSSRTSETQLVSQAWVLRSSPWPCITSQWLWPKVYDHDNNEMPWIYKDILVYKTHAPLLSQKKVRLEYMQGNSPQWETPEHFEECLNSVFPKILW